MSLLFCAGSFILMPWCSKPPSEIFKATETYGVHCYSKHFEVVSKTKHSKRRPKHEAPKSRKRSTYRKRSTRKRSTLIWKTKHPKTRKRRPQKLENEDPKLETGLSFINWLESLLLIQQESSTITNRMQFKSTQVVGFCTLC